MSQIHSIGRGAGFNPPNRFEELHVERTLQLTRQCLQVFLKHRNPVSMLRLPYAVKDLFLGWLQRELHERASKILNRIREVRAGELTNSQLICLAAIIPIADLPGERRRVALL